ncbi:hypothetical protein WG66_002608 [Moniliophthora roreri]|nr:hypothetical protein WG66_002608 [Moniliophthora roreri]
MSQQSQTFGSTMEGSLRGDEYLAGANEVNSIRYCAWPSVALALQKIARYYSSSPPEFTSSLRPIHRRRKSFALTWPDRQPDEDEVVVVFFRLLTRCVVVLGCQLDQEQEASETHNSGLIGALARRTSVGASKVKKVHETLQTAKGNNDEVFTFRLRSTRRIMLQQLLNTVDGAKNMLSEAYTAIGSLQSTLDEILDYCSI